MTFRFEKIESSLILNKFLKLKSDIGVIVNFHHSSSKRVIGPSLLLHQLSSSYSYLKDRMMQQEAEAQAASAAAAAAAVAAQQNAAVAYQTDGKHLNYK